MPRVQTGSVKIEYVRDGNAAAPAFLLLMGAGEQLVMWPRTLISALTDAGFQVIRLDYRDAGLSTKFDAFGPVDLGALVAALMAGESVSVPYTLSDMARDAIAVLDDCGIARAHIAGLSLGGMIAQTIAIEHSGRVSSLTSIASTTGDHHLPPPNPAIVMQMFALPSDAPPEAWIAARGTAMTAMQGTVYQATAEEIREAAAESVRRNLSPAGVTRELAASIVSPPRGEGLKQFKRPALVIHGTADQVMSPACGAYTAECLPNGTFVPIEGMGHGFSNALMPVWAEHLIAVARRASV